MNEELDNARIHEFTIYIVNSFMKSQLLERGYTWDPKDTNYDREFREAGEHFKLTRIMETLNVLVKELRAFTRNNEHFPRIVSLLDDIHPEGAHDAFNTISDELFCDGIGWSHIVTLLCFGHELAINCIENRNDDMVDRIAGWISSYINLKLSEWIKNQGGWVSIDYWFIQKTK